MMKRSIALLLSAISAPSLAVAQDISGGVTLGFGQHEIADQDLSTASLDGRIAVGFENGLSFGVEAGYLDVGIDDVPVNANGRFIGLDLAYRFSNGMSVGTYYEELTLSANLLPIDISLDSFGLTAGYSMETLEFGAFVGRGSTSPDIGLLLGSDVDIDNLGLTAKYTPMDNLNVGAALLRTRLSGGGDSLDIDMLGVAATYDVNPQFSVFAGLSRSSVDEFDLDVTNFGLGVGYDLSTMVGVASVVSLELARTDISGFGASEELDTIRLGLTFPLGGKGTEAPLNSVADSIFNPRHGALNATLTGSF